MIKAYIDGGCAPKNPGGTASFGLIVYQNDKEIYKRSAIIGEGNTMSNNVAEYAGLEVLLTFIKEKDILEKVRVYSDSQMLVNQMSGTWKSATGLYKPYYTKCIDLIGDLGSSRFEFKWIPSESNIVAHNLCQHALSTKKDVVEDNYSPPE